MRRLTTYIPFHFLLCVIVGISVQFYTNFWHFSGLKLLAILVIFCGILIAFNYFKKNILSTIFSWVLFVFIGVATTFFNDNRNYKDYYYNFLKENSFLVLRIDNVKKSGNFYDKYGAEVIQINNRKSCGKVLLNIKKDTLLKKLKVGDKIVSKFQLKKLISPLNPHQFNYKNYLAKQGIHHQIFSEKNQYKMMEKELSLLDLATKFRKKVQKSLKKYSFTNNEYAVINALLLGQRQDISKELLQNYTKAGAIHILAVSGLHVGIILLILNLLFKPITKLKNGIVIRTFLTVLFLWMFAFVAGLSASVVRAVTMFTAVAIGLSFKRSRVVEHSLIISMFLLLLCKPMFLFDVGFQLSYLAVFGIVWVQPKLYNLIKINNHFSNFYWKLLTVSIAAQFGILPLSLFYFNQFPGLFALSNLVIIPFLGVVLGLGILLIFLSLLNMLPQLFADFYGFIISLMNKFVGWVSSQERFLFTEISISFCLLILLYLIILFGFYFFNQKKNKQFLLFLGSILLFQGFYLFEKYQTETKNELIVFHKSRASILGVRRGKNLLVYSKVDSVINNQSKMMIAYRTHEKVKISYQIKTPTIFSINNKTLLRIDSLGVYKTKLKSLIILLNNSPKINLKRLITLLHPTKIIADGSNYKSYINKWQKTCELKNTPFYYTGESGAFIVK